MPGPGRSCGSTGRFTDIVAVGGDQLANIEAALKTQAVARRGRAD
jgi:hypothetical protein